MIIYSIYFDSFIARDIQFVNISGVMCMLPVGKYLICLSRERFTWFCEGCCFILFIWRGENPARADNAVSKNNTDDKIGPNTVTPFTSFRASSERSEGSVALGREMLRCAQHDSAVTHTNAWISLLHAIIGDGAITDVPIILLHAIKRPLGQPPSCQAA